MMVKIKLISSTKSKIIILVTLGIIFVFSPIITTNLSFITGNNNNSSENSNDINLDNENLKASQDYVLYSENFDDGIADDWEIIGGTWIVENKRYKATGTPGERVRSYYVNHSFSNYIYEGDFNLVSGNEMQIIFNIQDIFPGADQGHYSQLTFFYDDPGDDRKNSVILYSTQNYQVTHKKVSYNFNNNQWYHFTIISTGAYVEFFLNNSLVLSYSGLYNTFGYIGVKSMYGPTAYWDNIKVSGINNLRKIYLDGNSDWVDLKNAGNCTGQGTYANPYVIEDLIINAIGSGSGILVENSDVYFRIENITVYNSGGGGYYDAGIKLSNITNGKLINNTVNNNRYGIYLYSSDYNNISGNTVNNSSYYGYGIRLENSNYNTVSRNIAHNSGSIGINLDESNNNNISGNTANNNNIGIDLDESNNNNISRNIVNNNGHAGIYLEDSDDNTFSGNTVNYGGYGIRLINCNRNNILGNNVSYNNEGIRLYSSNYNLISGNTATNNGDGIEFWWGNSYNSISGNNVSNNRYGLNLMGGSCNNNNISGNTANNNQMYGILLAGYNSENNDISGNTANYNTIGIKLANYDNNVISWNIVKNNSNYGIYLETSDNNIVRFNTITNNDIGIYLWLSYSNEISNNTFSGNNVDFKEYIEPEFLIEAVVIIISVIIIAIAIAGILIIRRKRLSRKVEIKYMRKSGVTVQSAEESNINQEILKKREKLEEELVTPPEEIPTEEDVLKEVVVMNTPEEKSEKLLPSKPQLIICPFCGIELNEETTFCVQCGMKIKKK